MSYLHQQRMMRIRAKEELSTPKKQAEAFVAIERKINQAWDTLLEVEVMLETLQLSCDDQLQQEAYDNTARMGEIIRSIVSTIEDDLNVEPFDFEYQAEEEDEEITLDDGQIVELPKGGD